MFIFQILFRAIFFVTEAPNAEEKAAANYYFINVRSAIKELTKK